MTVWSQTSDFSLAKIVWSQTFLSSGPPGVKVSPVTSGASLFVLVHGVVEDPSPRSEDELTMSARLRAGLARALETEKSCAIRSGQRIFTKEKKTE